MKLMYPEVDIVPGRAGQRPQVTPVREEQPLPGSSVIRLNNTTTQENAFTVRVRSEDKFWQEGWYTVVALPPGQGAENAPPPGKPDQRGPQDRWVKIYVPRGGERDVLIRFNVPPRPESRAGKYKYFVEIETQVIGPTDGGRRKERVTQIPGVAIVRPYYKWSVDLSPEERGVGRRDRSGDFEVVVTNEGNDWLYCDMQLPRPKDLQLDSPTLRLAVPPPEPGETLPPLPGSTEVRPGTQRTVPLAAVTKLKVFRGEITRQPIQLSAQRVDAPSVPPSATDGYAGLGAVIAAPTTEKAQVGDRALIYHPPVPAKFTDFFTRGATSIRTMAFGLIGIAAAAVVTVYMYQVAFFQGVKVEPQSLSAQAGGTLLVGGQFLQGCKMYMGTKGNYVEVPYRPADLRFNRMIITKVPAELNHQEVKVMAQRFVWILPFLTPLLPHNESKSLVQVGSLVVQQGPPTVDPVNPGPFKPGDHVTITGKNLGTSGAVVVNGLKVTNVVSWAPEKIVFAAPQAAPGATLPVKVVPAGGTSLDATAFQITPAQTASNTTGTGNTNPPKKPTNTTTPPKKPTVTTPPKTQQTANGNPPSKTQQTASNNHPPKTVTAVIRPPALLGAAPYDLIMAGGDNSYTKAIGAAQDRVNLNRNDAESLALEAYAWVKSGHSDRARPLVARAVALTQSEPKSRARAYALVAQGSLADADGRSKDKATLDIFTAAGNVNETFGLPYIAYADHLVKVKQSEFAKAVLQEGMSKVTSTSDKSAIQQKLSGL